jgi:hypothetical protein
MNWSKSFINSSSTPEFIQLVGNIREYLGWGVLFILWNNGILE